MFVFVLLLFLFLAYTVNPFIKAYQRMPNKTKQNKKQKQKKKTLKAQSKHRVLDHVDTDKLFCVLVLAYCMWYALYDRPLKKHINLLIKNISSLTTKRKAYHSVFICKAHTWVNRSVSWCEHSKLQVMLQFIDLCQSRVFFYIVWNWFFLSQKGL